VVTLTYLGLLTLLSFFRSAFKVGPGVLLCALYFASVAGSLLLDQSLKPASSDYSWTATLMFLGLLTVFLIPFIYPPTTRINTVVVPNIKAFNIISYFFIFLGFFTYAFFVPTVYSFLDMDLSIAGIRGQVASGKVYYDIGFSYYFVTLGSQFYPIVILFYFQSCYMTPERKFFNRLLLFASTAYIVNVLASLGRDGFVLWFLSFIFVWLIYKPILKKKLVLAIKRNLYFLLSLFFFGFMLISAGRFLKGGDFYLFFQYFLLYFSQQFGEFNRYHTVINSYDVDLPSLFPIMDLVIPKNNELSLMDDHNRFLEKYGFSKYVFKTFLSDFYVHLGILGAFLTAVLLFSIYFGLFFSSNWGRVRFGTIIIFTLGAQVLLHGVFYYKLAYSVSNLYFLIVPLLALLVSYKFSFGSKL
jgi:hypothetical protein